MDWRFRRALVDQSRRRDFFMGRTWTAMARRRLIVALLRGGPRACGYGWKQQAGDLS
jgi:hypothetical protein